MLVKITRYGNEWLNPAQIIERNNLSGYTATFVADNPENPRENLWEITGENILADFAILQPENFGEITYETYTAIDTITGEEVERQRIVEWEAHVRQSVSIIEAAKQAAKSLKLKQSENAFLSIVMQVPNVAIGDNSDVLTAKIEADTAMTETQKLSLGLKLLNAIHEVELQGGSWYDLPSVPHVIEVPVVE